MTTAATTAPLIVLEGIDGAGKGTQAAILTERLQHAGYCSALLGFPRYQSTFFGARIGEFLDGQFGSLDQLDPFLISLLYAGDRFESRTVLETERGVADVVVLDRYVSSNIAHQSAKLSVPRRAQLRQWIEHIEYGIFALPRPQLTVLLDIPVSASQELIRRKQKRSYTDQQTDLQEADTHYLGCVRDVYLSLAQTEPGWSVIPVVEGAQIRTVEAVSDALWEAVQPLLTPRNGTRHVR
jgi:dTMP kinase